MLEEPDIFTLRPGNFGGTLSWYASPRGDLLHTDGLQATDAQWVLERCARDRSRPFFLAVGFFRPHTPYVSPKEYFAGYPEKDMPLVQGVEEDVKDLPADALGSHKKEHELLTDSLRQQAIQAYFASVSFMDAQVGRVLDALERLELADNTIVVFMSDHGYHLGEHGLWQKMSLFEESSRVPLIIAVPGQDKKGAVASTPVGLVDVYPTLAELCGVPAPENLQGQSLVPILKDSSLPGRGWALSQVTRGPRAAAKKAARPSAPSSQAADETRPAPTFGFTLRTPRWRYTEWDEGNRGRELYDHQNDPLEQTNLADDPAQAEQVAQLSRQLRAAVADTLPESGEIPQIQEGLWAPNLTDP